ncbi:hypothetical protein V8C40DRAFT_185017 [Trichoderma camerunense]
MHIRTASSLDSLRLSTYSLLHSQVSLLQAKRHAAASCHVHVGEEIIIPGEKRETWISPGRNKHESSSSVQQPIRLLPSCLLSRPKNAHSETLETQVTPAARKKRTPRKPPMPHPRISYAIILPPSPRVAFRRSMIQAENILGKGKDKKKRQRRCRVNCSSNHHHQPSSANRPANSQAVSTTTSRPSNTPAGANQRCVLQEEGYFPVPAKKEAVPSFSPKTKRLQATTKTSRVKREERCKIALWTSGQAD